MAFITDTFTTTPSSYLGVVVLPNTALIYQKTLSVRQFITPVLTQ